MFLFSLFVCKQVVVGYFDINYHSLTFHLLSHFQAHPLTNPKAVQVFDTETRVRGDRSL